MRPNVLFSLTLATLLAAPVTSCGPKRSALDIASSQPQTTAPGQTIGAPPLAATHTPAPASTPPAAAPATTPAPAPAPATTPQPAAPTPATPVAATTPPPATPPAAPTTPVVSAPQGDPACLAGCNSPSLAPEVQQTCRIQCARLAQQSTTAPATTPTTAPAQPQPQPDYAHQRALCESTCDAEKTPGDRATCRLNCSQIGPSNPNSYPYGGYSGSSGGSTTYPAGTPASAQRQQEIAACQASCDREASATDRATCRNNCGAYGTYLGTSGPSGYVAGPAPGTSYEDQRAAVIRSSGGVAGTTGGTTPPPQNSGYQPPNPQCAAQAQSCKIACANEQTACNAECDRGKMSETDRATCRLTCTAAGDTCRDDCRIKEGQCTPAVYK